MPSRPVRLVSDGGMPVRVVTGGLSDPVRVVTDGPSDPVRVVTSGPSDPVRVISGSLTPVVSDPIGDGLRTDAIAYWKLDEASGVRYDSTAHHIDLTMTDLLGKSSVVPGKIGSAIKHFDDFDDPPYLYVDGLSIDISGGYSLTTWIWFNQFVPDNDQNFAILESRDSSNAVSAKLNCGILVDGQPEISVYESGLEFSPLSINTWHFVMVSEVPGAATVIRVDDQASITTPNALNNLPLINLTIARGDWADNTTDYLIVDELGLYALVMDDDQYNYLWNDGTGRTLFP